MHRLIEALNDGTTALFVAAQKGHVKSSTIASSS